MTYGYVYQRIKGISARIIVMGIAFLMIGAFVSFTSSAALAQSYDLVLKGGHVIDPKDHIDAVRDVAVKDGKIALVAKNIPANDAKKIIDVSGFYVTPGLIDIHTHDFWGYTPHYNYGGGYDGVQPDKFTFRAGVTTVVDAGSSGWRTFHIFKKRVIDHAKTRILAFLNIVGHGMRDAAVTQQDIRDMNAKLTAERIEQYPDILVGVKLAHFRGHNWIPAKRAEKAANMSGTRIMVDFGSANPVLPLDSLLLDVMTPGDIMTHCFANLQRGNPLRGRESIVDLNYNLRPFIKKAQKKGIIFDVGHGSGSFEFHTAIAAMKTGFRANSISSDMHYGNVNGDFKNFDRLMSKFLALGEPLQLIIKQSTWNPAQEVGHPELGNLSPGAPADIAVLKVDHGQFGFIDSDGGRLMGDEELVAVLTVRAGDIVWDLNGISHQPWKKVPREGYGK